MRTVADIMQRDVRTVSRNTSIRELVQLLSEAEVTGVPVVDETRKVVGVVSQTDVVRFAAQESEFSGLGSPASGPPDGGNDEEDWPESYFVAPEEWGVVPGPSAESLTGSAFEDVTVAEIMTPVAYAVPPETTIPGLARFMVEGRIHRALVVDDDVLVGIVTAFDVLRLVGAEAEA